MKTFNDLLSPLDIRLKSSSDDVFQGSWILTDSTSLTRYRDYISVHATNMRALARQAQLLASFREALRERAATRIDLPPEYVEALEIVM